MEDAHSKSGRGLQATLTAASPFAAAASRAAPIRAALPTNLGLGGHLNSLPQPDSGHGHVQHSYVEALVDYLCPGLPSHARHQILSRFPAKCMEVQTPSAGVRHDLLSSNIGCDTPGMICGLTREEALVFAIVRFDGGLVKHVGFAVANGHFAVATTARSTTRRICWSADGRQEGQHGGARPRLGVGFGVGARRR